MSPALEKIINAHGTFPPEPKVLEGFDAVLARAERESPEDLTAALHALIDQHSAVAARMPESLADRICDWAEQALARDEAPVRPLAALLVNAGTERSLRILRSLTSRGDEAASVSREMAAQHPLAAGKPSAPGS
jgi:hypothetical protein